MKYSFENQGENRYLVAEISQDMELDTLTLGMITNNQISGYAQASQMQMDSIKYVKYNISQMISLSELFQKTVNKYMVQNVFNGVCDALSNAENYMINEECILLDQDKIFVNPGNGQVFVICVPVIGVQASVDIGLMFKSLLFNARFDTTENNDYVGKLLNHLNSNNAFSITEFQNILNEICGDTQPSKPLVGSPVTQLASSANQMPVLSPKDNLSSQGNSIAAPVPTLTSIQSPVSNIVNENISMTVNQAQIGKYVNANIRSEQSIPQPPDDMAATGFNIPQMLQTDRKKEKKGFSLFGRKDTLENSKKEDKVKKEKTKKEKLQKSIKGGVPSDIIIPGTTPTLGGKNGSSNDVNNSKVAQPMASKSGNCGSVSDVSSSVGNMKKQLSAQSPINAQISVQSQLQPQVTHGANFGETTVLGAGRGDTTVLISNAGDTTVLSQQMPNAYLLRLKNNERVIVDKPVYRIGKEKSYVDYFIPDNTAISRSHANIINRDGHYYIEDMKSTNHTFVNGMLLQSEVETEIINGTRIRLANEDFEFQIE